MFARLRRCGRSPNEPGIERGGKGVAGTLWWWMALPNGFKYWFSFASGSVNLCSTWMITLCWHCGRTEFSPTAGTVVEHNCSFRPTCPLMSNCAYLADYFSCLVAVSFDHGIGR